MAPSTLNQRANVSGRCAVQRMATSTGRSVGAIHQPLKPPSTSCGGPRLPAAVEADQDGWKPSPSTSQHPSGHPSTVTSRLVRPDARTVTSGGDPADDGAAAGRSALARTTRSTSRPVTDPGAVATRCVPAASSSGPSHGSAATGSPASRSATSPWTRTGTAIPSTVTRSSRHPVSSCAGTVVGAPIVISLTAAGSTTGSAYRRSSVDRGSIEVISTRSGPAGSGAGSATTLVPPASGGPTGDVDDGRPARQAQPGDRRVLPAGLRDRERGEVAGADEVEGRADRAGERRLPRRRRVTVRRRPAGRVGDPGQARRGAGSVDAEEVASTSSVARWSRRTVIAGSNGPRRGQVDVANERRLRIGAPAVGRAASAAWSARRTPACRGRRPARRRHRRAGGRPRRSGRGRCRSRRTRRRPAPGRARPSATPRRRS